jgi:hypothetical protein
VLPTSTGAKLFTVLYAAWGCFVAIISLMKVLE